MMNYELWMMNACPFGNEQLVSVTAALAGVWFQRQKPTLHPLGFHKFSWFSGRRKMPIHQRVNRLTVVRFWAIRTEAEWASRSGKWSVLASYCKF